MKRIYLYIGIFIILVFSFFSCYEISPPEIQIWKTSQHIFSVTQSDSLINVDSTTFWVRNGVDSKLLGYYAEFYRSTLYGEPNIFLYEDYPYYLELYIRASVRKEDTVLTTLLDMPIHIKEAVEMMYSVPESEWKSIQVSVNFFGEDAYNEGKTFRVVQDYTLYRAD